MAIFCIRACIFWLCLSVLRGETVKVQILHTTDIHCQLHNHQGGWVKLSGVINKLRQNKSLLIDCGDTIQGSVEAVATQGEVAIDFLNYLKYDAWALGNHELDFGIPRLYELLKKTRIPALSGNFSLLPPYAMKFPAYKIYTIQGAKIAVIGMQASFLEHWFVGGDYEGYSVEKVVEVLPGILKELEKERVDMTILAMHHGFKFKDTRGVNEVTDVAKFFPQIDLILGGHTHQYYPGRNIYGTYYSQAGYHASHLGEVMATINLQQKKVEALESRLINVQKEAVEDDGANKIYEHWKPVLEKFSNELIVELKEEISAKGYPGLGSQTSSLIAHSLIEATEADYALHGKLSKNSLSGKVTMRQLFNVIPYENNIYVLSLNETQLRKVLDEQMPFFKKSHFNAPAGFIILVDPKSKTIKNLQIPKQKIYKVAVNSRVAAGGGGRFHYIRRLIKSKTIKFREVKINTRDAVKAYLQKDKALQFENTVQYTK
ncbi:MAG: bifunctional metallophosphatase/5'-nucleotidase [Lentisphaerales bacterium]|nr:bifunctional metallophosphatase/5'-nucleotidase [Lentisphaerales bacterium]